jgi:hypothetical protein
MEFKNHNQPPSTTLYHIVDNFLKTPLTTRQNQFRTTRQSNKSKGFDFNVTMSIFGKYMNKQTTICEKTGYAETTGQAN